MKRIFGLLLTLVMVVGLGVSLAGCGDTLGEQAVFGAGAGVGTAVVTHGDPLTGAVVGAAANIAYCRAYPSRCN